LLHIRFFRRGWFARSSTAGLIACVLVEGSAAARLGTAHFAIPEIFVSREAGAVLYSARRKPTSPAATLNGVVLLPWWWRRR